MKMRPNVGRWEGGKVSRRHQKRDKEIRQAVRIAIIGLIVGTLLALLVIPAFAMPGDDMDLRTFFAVEKLDYSQKSTYLAALAFQDYKQSVDMFFSNTNNNIELNPVLGRHPDRTRLMVFGASALVCAYIFVERFPEGRLKHILLDSVIATEQMNVIENRNRQLYNNHRTGMPIMVVVSMQF